MKRSKVLATIGVAVLILGGCGNDTGGAKGSSAKGSDDRSPADQAYVDELVASVKEDAGDDPTFPSDQVECWVGDMVDGVGAAKLKKAGLTADNMALDDDGVDIEQLSQDDRKVVSESFAECVDLEEMVTASMASAAGDEELPKEMEDCFAAIDWKAIEGDFAEMILSGDDAEDSPAMAPLMGCMMMGMFGGMSEEMDAGTGG
jgi:hypothetical protein